MDYTIHDCLATIFIESMNNNFLLWNANFKLHNKLYYISFPNIKIDKILNDQSENINVFSDYWEKMTHVADEKWNIYPIIVDTTFYNISKCTCICLDINKHIYNNKKFYDWIKKTHFFLKKFNKDITYIDKDIGSEYDCVIYKDNYSIYDQIFSKYWYLSKDKSINKRKCNIYNNTKVTSHQDLIKQKVAISNCVFANDKKYKVNCNKCINNMKLNYSNYNAIYYIVYEFVESFINILDIYNLLDKLPPQYIMLFKKNVEYVLSDINKNKKKKICLNPKNIIKYIRPLVYIVIHSRLGECVYFKYIFHKLVQNKHIYLKNTISNSSTCLSENYGNIII